MGSGTATDWTLAICDPWDREPATPGRARPLRWPAVAALAMALVLAGLIGHLARGDTPGGGSMVAALGSGAIAAPGE